ncbi:MAG: imidazole glycerol phosphate synthase subunit HisH [Haliea sp.]
MPTVAILDYGTSNLRSVAKAVEHIAGKQQRVIVTADADQIRSADRLIFPGQGAIGQCMTSLQDSGLDEIVRESINSKPFLGICLGLQTLLDESAEDGGRKGLGIIPGKVKRFQPPPDGGYKIPHMGWNQVWQQQAHPLWQGIDDGARFYFVHSYYVAPDDNNVIAGSCDYIVDFTAAIARDNLFATQFHPEKSQKDGLKLLENFLDWNA